MVVVMVWLVMVEVMVVAVMVVVVAMVMMSGVWLVMRDSCRLMCDDGGDGAVTLMTAC